MVNPKASGAGIYFWPDATSGPGYNLGADDSAYRTFGCAALLLQRQCQIGHGRVYLRRVFCRRINRRAFRAKRSRRLAEKSIRRIFIGRFFKDDIL